jgi:hypothetical protein
MIGKKRGKVNGFGKHFTHSRLLHMLKRKREKGIVYDESIPGTELFQRMPSPEL